MIIEIKGLSEADELAVKDMLAMWVSLGSQGASRWTAFFADGDGAFHPEITVDGQAPEGYRGSAGTWVNISPSPTTHMYMIDPDAIAVDLRK